MNKTAIRTFFKEQVEPKYGDRVAQNLERVFWEDYVNTDIFPNEELSDDEQSAIKGKIDQLLNGYPIQHLVGKALFYGMGLKVNSDVLIPRPETEELVHYVQQYVVKEKMTGKPFLDVGTGSGCIALALKRQFPDNEVLAIEKSEAALAVAQENADNLDLAVKFHHMDVFDREAWANLPELNLLISNPPYIPEKEKSMMSQNVLDHEPPMALFVPDDQALMYYEILAELGKAKLADGGMLALEINEHSASETLNVFAKAGYQNLSVNKDLSQRFRFIFGIKP